MIAGYIGIAAAVIVAGTAAYAWDADRAFKREHDRAEAATMQRDQFQKGLTQCRAEIAEKNAIIHRFQGLPVERLRLCATRPPSDPCCRAAPAPPAADECRP